MRRTILGFAAGAALLQTQASLPAPWLLGLLSAGLLLLLFARKPLSRLMTHPTIGWPLPLACGMAAGFVWAALLAHHYLQQELPSEWEGRDITLVGTVASLPDRIEQGVRFNFEVEQVMPADGAMPVVPSRLALSWYAGYGGSRGDDAQAVENVQPGERWQLTVRLRRPHGNANPYGFDYEAWLLEQDLRATGYVRSDRNAAEKNRRLDAFVPGFAHVIERSRGALRERILAALADREYAGVIVALVIGDQRGVPQSDWKVFNRTGIGHLISISGLHITMVAGMFAGLVFALWRRSFFTGAQLPLLLPAQKAAALAGVAMALLYVLLAGFGVPAQRTLYMLVVVAAALWMDRLTSVSHVLCLALGVVILFDPWAVLWPGFWLSFGAVAVILYATVGRTAVLSEQASRRDKWIGILKTASLTQYAVTLGLVPLTVLLFGQVSLLSPLANAVAIPLVSFVVTPLALAGSVLPAPLSGWALLAAHQCVAGLAFVLRYLSELPVAVWAAPIPSWWMFACALTGTLWLLAPRGWPSRWLGLAGWLPLLLNVPVAPPPGQMWVTALDVGQGMALLVETPRHRLLYDTGPYYSPESDGGNRVILPYLKGRGISRLDTLVVSHKDNDHSGGALSILGEIAVDRVTSSLPPDHAIVQAAASHVRCAAGQGWEWDGVRFEMLHPTEGSYDSSKWKPNARSCTLKVTIGTQSILLAGDIEAVQESELVSAQGERLASTVLLAPHHGSGTSSTREFLEAVKPRLAIFQVGYRNRFHHPKAEVYERYGGLGIERLRSDEAGAIALQFGATLKVHAFRTEQARYWHAR